MSDDLFDIFNDDVSSFAPAGETLSESGGTSSPSVIVPDTRTDAPDLAAPEKRLASTKHVVASPICDITSGALKVPTSHLAVCASSPVYSASPAIATARATFVSSGTALQSPSLHKPCTPPGVPRSSCPTSSSLPWSTSSGMTVINAAQTSIVSPRENDARSLIGDEACNAPRVDAASGRAIAPPPSALFTEAFSRIRVRRATVSFEQFSVRLAEFPFASFDVFRSMLSRSDEALGRTCVGVVTRKSDPKQNTTASRSSRYAVLTLWSMDGISPTPETELSVLLCGSAFELLYSRLVTGSVVALSNIGRCARKGPAPAKGANEVLLRVVDSEAVRQLGFAADLGTCASVSYKSSERCHTIVNTQRSLHCAYHVADLRRAVRSGSTIGQDRDLRHSTRGAGAGSSDSPAVMRGGVLTTNRTLSGSQQRLSVLTPGGIVPRCAGHHHTGSVSGGRLQSGPVVNSRRVASQQMLRQTSFFAVRGASGLPVEDAAARSGINSAGSGVYGGVQAGAPLALQKQAGLRPAASYPSPQALGVTSRGRDVLEAARQQAVHLEEERLLRLTMRDTHTVGAPREDLSTQVRVDHGGSISGDARGGALQVGNGSAEGVSRLKSTRISSTSSAQKRARAEAPLSSLLASPSAPAKYTGSSSASLPVPIASTSLNASATPEGGADGDRVEALRRQFQPLHRGVSAPFAPLQTHGAVHAVIASPRQKDYRHNVIMSGSPAVGTGASASQSALLRAASKAARDLKRKTTESTGFKTPTSDSSVLCDADHCSEVALTLLGSVADSLQSTQDHLRSEANRQSLLTFVDKQITKEKALEALEAITEQQIKAHYCYACRCWYGQPPTTCVEQHHRLELKAALKKYIKCEHCHYKTFVIGGKEAEGWKVYPCCPRCRQSSFWVRGDAALQVSGVVETSLSS